MRLIQQQLLISCVTASTSEYRNQTITNKLENWKVPNIVRMEKARTEEITTLKEMAEDLFGLPYHKIEVTTFENINQTSTNRLKK